MPPLDPTSTFPDDVDTFPVIDAEAGDTWTTEGKEHDRLHNKFANAIETTQTAVQALGAGGDVVTSINGQTGDVNLDAPDVNADPAGSAVTAQAAAIAASQPVDADLTAIALLSTTSYGRALLELADAAALRTAAGLGTAATQASGAFDAAGAASAAQAAAIAASQPVDSDLTAIAALSTTSFGRSFLTLADAAAGRTLLGLGSAALSATTAFDPAGTATSAVAAEATARDTAISTAISNLVAGAPGALDTLNEISTQLSTDESAVSALTATVGTKVAKSTYDAQSILAAVTDDTPAALVVAEQTIVGRITGGNIAALTGSQVKTLLVLVKGDVGLGNVDNTSDAAKNAATATLTNKTLTSPVITTPTGIVATDIASGTFAIGRIPTGTTSTTVPLGGVITAAGPVGDASHTLALTYNAAGQVTTVTNNAIAISESQVTNLVSDLALLAPISNPSFTGGVTVAGPVLAGGGFQGLDFVGTEYANGACTIDLRSFGGSAGSETATPSGTTLGGMHIGGWGTGGIDCAQIYCRATQTFSGTQSGTAWDFYTTTNGTNVKTVALTLDNDGLATFRSGAVFGGAITASTQFVLGTFATSPGWFFRRANGSSGSESQVLSTQTIATLNFQGWNNSSAQYLTSAAITVVADQDFTTTGFRGSSMKFFTAPSSVNGGALCRLIIDNAGKLWFGSSTSATTSIDQSGNFAIGGTLAVVGNVGFNGKTPQALTGWSAPTATALRTAAPNATYSTTGGTGATAGAFDTAAHRDNVITDLANTMRRLGTLEADLIANGTIG